MLKKTLVCRFHRRSPMFSTALQGRLKDGRDPRGHRWPRLALVDEEVKAAKERPANLSSPPSRQRTHPAPSATVDVEPQFGENQASFGAKNDKGFSVLLVTNWKSGKLSELPGQLFPAKPRTHPGFGREEPPAGLRRAEIPYQRESQLPSR